MNVLYTEALFHSFFFLLFFFSAWSMWRRYRINGSILSKYLSLSFLFGGIEYIFLTLSILVFPYDPFLAKILGLFVAMPVFYIAMLWIWLMLPYVFPKFPMKVVIGTLALLLFATFVVNFLSSKPLPLTEAGVLLFAVSDLSMLFTGLLMLGTFIPLTSIVVWRSVKSKLYFQAVTIGAGLTIQIIFMPLTYQAKTFESYIFLSLAALTGFLLVTVGIIATTYFRAHPEITSTN